MEYREQSQEGFILIYSHQVYHKRLLIEILVKFKPFFVVPSPWLIEFTTIHMNTHTREWITYIVHICVKV